MPAKNPRLTITLQPSLAAQLRKLSELTGSSQSGLIGDLLEGSGPVFDRMIQVLEAAKTAKESMRGRIAGDMEHAQMRLEQGLGMATDGFDQFPGALLDEAEAVTRRARARGALHAPGATAPTPLSNRGVRSDPKPLKTPLKTTTSARSLQKSEQAKKPAQKRAKKGAA